ncbi:MAG TPA: TVP38/TMEM64 family protein [Hyphomicrobiaceae bacterium]|nr:TVP38/TMEM64 family protein [Hyphomicrobiaceae bacterium]
MDARRREMDGPGSLSLPGKAGGPVAVSRLRRFGPLLAVGGLSLLALVAGYLSGDLDQVGFRTLLAFRDQVQGLLGSSPALSVLCYVAIYVLVVSLSLPGSALLTLSGGLLFGTVTGGMAAVIGATAGAIVIFLVASTAIGDIMARRAGPMVQMLRSGFQKNALSYLLFLRITPAIPFFIVNLVSGVLGIPLRTYVIGTFFGVMPASFAFASVGSGLDSLIAEAQRSYEACRAASAGACSYGISPSSLITTEIKTAFVLLGLLALSPVAFRAWRSRRDDDRAEGTRK